MSKISSVRDLEVYKLSFSAAMEIFKIANNFPHTEKYILSEQIIKSSRSVCSNISEAWRKRKYIAVFLNKLSDAAQESSETQTWLDFALALEYIDNTLFKQLDEKYEHIFAMLSTMERKADTFCSPKIVPRPSEHKRAIAPRPS